MSKLITSVAALILFEEARFRLNDPVGDYLPEFARMKVFTGGTAENPLLADAKHPITIKHLFTHTSGLTSDGDDGVEKLYREAKLEESESLDDFVTRVARLPLAHEPGERFTYGVSTDILGALVQKVSGRPLADFVEERICQPMGMRDTGFFVSEAKRGRLAKVYEKGSDGRLQPAKSPVDRPFLKYPQGGGGMVSTASDYARFMQMLLNGGQLDGVRILSRKTVELMMANHLGAMVLPPRFRSIVPGAPEGFGLGGAVRLDVARGDALGSVGEFSWGGAYTTYAALDPKETTVVILLVQHVPLDEHKIGWRFFTLFYQAIVD